MAPMSTHFSNERKMAFTINTYIRPHKSMNCILCCNFIGVVQFSKDLLSLYAYVSCMYIDGNVQMEMTASQDNSFMIIIQMLHVNDIHSTATHTLRMAHKEEPSMSAQLTLFNEELSADPICMQIYVHICMYVRMLQHLCKLS